MKTIINRVHLKLSHIENYKVIKFTKTTFYALNLSELFKI